MSYREAMLRAEEKSRAIVATWPGYQRDLLAEWMKRYDPAPGTQSILDYTPGENRLARFLYLTREALKKPFCDPDSPRYVTSSMGCWRPKS